VRFSTYQWVLCIVLDFLIKSGCCYLLSAVTLGAAPIFMFFYIAIGWSILNFTCLLLARGALAVVSLSQEEQFPFVVVFGNILFVGIMILLKMLAFDGAVAPLHFSVILTVVIINMLPILISAAFGCLEHRIRRSFAARSVDVSVND
jgi:hypothetical protein